MVKHPQSDSRILSRRTLERDHRHLAKLLRPGLSVLDVGCGTGAITAGIAKAVGPHGFALGVDRDAKLLEIACREHAGIPNLRFECADATGFQLEAHFDVVTAARTLQWIDEPGEALAQMKRAAKPSGVVVALDYNHAANEWEPAAPVDFQRFYRAFLKWREAHGWSNEMADHLPELFRAAGLYDVESINQDEVAERGDPNFAEAAELWSQVVRNLGEQISSEGFLNISELQGLSDSYSTWAKTKLVRQTLRMQTVVGKVP